MSRIVIITGGSSGICRALEAALVARGDDVVLAARTEADLQRTADELSAQGPGKARGAVLDVRNAGEVTDLVNDVYGSYGRLDLMINNAGISVIGFADELTRAGRGRGGGRGQPFEVTWHGPDGSAGHRH